MLSHILLTTEENIVFDFNYHCHLKLVSGLMMQCAAFCLVVLQKAKKWGERKEEKDNKNRCRKKKNVVLLPREMKLEKGIRREE